MNKEFIPAVSDLIDFREKNVIITGAGAGIGEAIAHRFAEHGAALYLLDVDEDALDRVKRNLSGLSHHVQVFRIDLTKKSEIELFWTKNKDIVFDVLINNAGGYPMKDYEETDESFLKKLEDLNLHAAYWMSQQFIQQRCRERSCIVNITSIEALLPFKEDIIHYSASKAGVIALSRGLAKEFARKNLRVNVIISGAVMKPGTKSLMGEAQKGKFKLIRSGIEYNLRMPMGRYARADEIARMVLVLASDFASYVTGAVIPVDGGFLSV